jgi:hypothetical protein
MRQGQRSPVDVCVHADQAHTHTTWLSRRACLHGLGAAGMGLGMGLSTAAATAQQVPAVSSASSLSSPAKPRRALDLTAWQRTDGALVLSAHEPDVVDPYFALKGLWLAHHLGLDVAAAWAPWAAWMVQHQQANGLWGRWRLTPTGVRPDRASDADDSLLALVRHAPGLRKAAAHLQGPLFNARLGVYRVFAKDDAHLWMDNIEVWSALLSLAQGGLSWCEGLPGATQWQQSAQALQLSMARVFVADGVLLPRVSTQRLPEPAAFYPQAVTAPFAWLHGWDPAGRPSARMAAWLVRHEAAWVAQAHTDFPWGLVAVAAQTEGQPEAVHRWLERARPLRQGPRWNILEEVAFQGLSTVNQNQGVDS